MKYHQLQTLVAVSLTFAGLVASTSFAQPAPAAAKPESIVGTTPPNNQARVSPHAVTSQNIGAGADRTQVTISYGRPYTILPGTTVVRKIWGGQVPWEKAYRLGADEATTLTTGLPLMIGTTTIPAGTYALYMIPSESGVSKIALSTNVAKWGIPVDEKHDVGRFDLKKETLPAPVDQLTIVIAKDPTVGPNAGAIQIRWETTQFSLPFTVTK